MIVQAPRFIYFGDALPSNAGVAVVQAPRFAFFGDTLPFNTSVFVGTLSLPIIFHNGDFLIFHNGDNVVYRMPSNPDVNVFIFSTPRFVYEGEADL